MAASPVNPRTFVGGGGVPALRTAVVVETVIWIARRRRGARLRTDPRA